MNLKISNKKLAKLARLEVLNMIFESKSAHIGSCFSCIDIIAVIYNKIINLKKIKYNRKNISKQLSNFNEILVMEDHYLDGGFYSYILETIAKYKIKNLNTSNFSLSSKYNYFSVSQKKLNLKNGLI